MNYVLDINGETTINNIIFFNEFFESLEDKDRLASFQKEYTKDSDVFSLLSPYIGATESFTLKLYEETNLEEPIWESTNIYTKLVSVRTELSPFGRTTQDLSSNPLRQMIDFKNL